MARVAPVSSGTSSTPGMLRGDLVVDGSSNGAGGSIRSGRVRRNSVDITGDEEDTTVRIDRESATVGNSPSSSYPPQQQRLTYNHDDPAHGCYGSESSDDESHDDDHSSDDDEDEEQEYEEHRKHPRPTHASGGDSSRKSGKRPATPISSPASLQLQGNYKKARQSPSSLSACAQTKNHPRMVSSQTDESIESEFYRPTLRAIAPTLAGIHELVQHLRLHPSLNYRGASQGVVAGGCSDSCSSQRRSTTSMVALPTECTYEVCSLVSWSKNESLTENDEMFRMRQLDHLKSAASNEVLHVYLPHQNIQLLDTLLDFPKKKYALKRCPNDVANFNESRVVFQRLADLFWPGACIIYLSPESDAPSGLVQKHAVAGKNGQIDVKPFIGFRCPSHPLAVRVQKQLQQASSHGPLVLVGSSVREGSAIGETIEGTIEGYSSSSDSSVSFASSPLLKAKDVIRKFGESMSSLDSTVRVLQGEERKEIFAVPTCQFEDAVLECWIDAPARQITLKGRSQRTVHGRHVLTPSNTKNVVLRSVLQHWQVVDERDPRADVTD